MTATLSDVALTPPKFQAKLAKQEDVMLLEERLEQFVAWLVEHNAFIMWGGDYERVLDPEEITELIEEFVDS